MDLDKYDGSDEEEEVEAAVDEEDLWESEQRQQEKQEEEAARKQQLGPRGRFRAVRAPTALALWQASELTVAACASRWSLPFSFRRCCG